VATSCAASAEREPQDAEASGVVLAATDPANPYGAALAWPEAGTPRLARAARCHVVLVDGQLVAFLSKDAAALAAWLPEAEPERSRLGAGAAAALASWASRTHHAGVGWENEAPTPLAPYLDAAGFATHGPGFRVRDLAPPKRR
jgi:ATP-dependent Lhr-like helicase